MCTASALFQGTHVLAGRCGVPSGGSRNFLAFLVCVFRVFLVQTLKNCQPPLLALPAYFSNFDSSLLQSHSPRWRARRLWRFCQKINGASLRVLKSLRSLSESPSCSSLPAPYQRTHTHHEAPPRCFTHQTTHTRTVPFVYPKPRETTTTTNSHFTIPVKNRITEKKEKKNTLL